MTLPLVYIPRIIPDDYFDVHEIHPYTYLHKRDLLKFYLINDTRLMLKFNVRFGGFASTCDPTSTRKTSTKPEQRHLE